MPRLDDMNPAKMQLIFADAAENSSPERFVARLFVYEATAKASVDKLIFSTGEEESSELSELTGQIEDAMKKITQVKEEHLTWLKESYIYMSPLRTSQNGSGDQTSGKFYELIALREILSKWKGVQESLVKVYAEEYRSLITSKKEVFQKIKKQLVANAERKLYF